MTSIIKLDESKSDLLSEYEENIKQVLTALIKEYRNKYLAIENHHHHHHHDHLDVYLSSEYPLSERRKMLGRLICIRPFKPPHYPSLSPLILDKIDSILAFENSRIEDEMVTLLDNAVPPLNKIFNKFPLSNNDDLSFLFDKLYLYQGSITRLKCDAIVNAANNKMMGCFQPNHLCIDNIIHAQAGPRLRMACYQALVHKVEQTNSNKDKENKDNDNDDEEDDDEMLQVSTGECFVTPAFSLPGAKFIIHTPGPSIQADAAPSSKQKAQLALCYTNCLNQAFLNPNIHSIAFCSISTGLFGFPGDEASVIAMETVTNWILKQKSSNEEKINSFKVIFNVFKDEDLQFYQQTLLNFAVKKLKVNTGDEKARLVYPSPWNDNSLVNPSTSLAHSKSLELACSWLSASSHVLISGAAGLTASAGLDYTSETLFKKHFPAMHNRGFKCMYQFIGFQDWTPALQWGYFLSHANLVRYNWPKSQVYQDLLAISNIKNTWVNTSNADGFFEQNGFNKENIYTIQGEYGYLQCLEPCSNTSRWPTNSFFQGLSYIDPNTNEITNDKYIPKCRNCGGSMMLNVRGGDWFLEDPYKPQKEKFNKWLHAFHSNSNENKVKDNNDKNMVIIEIGAGFNTPSVLRWPNERLARNHKNIKLIRINKDNSEVPLELKNIKALSLPLDASFAIRSLINAIRK